MPQNLEELKARLAKSSVLASRSNSLLKITDDEPVTFFVLAGDYSSKAGFVHPVGLHYDENRKQIVCREVADAGICKMCERIRSMEKQGMPESQIFPLRGPKKFAMNVLVKGELASQIYFAPDSVFDEMLRSWEALEAEKINIFDPMASRAWTVTRSKRDGRAHYQVSLAKDPMPIVTGDHAEERIEKILKSVADLDVRFKLPA